MSFDTLFGLRERVAPNLDRAIAQVTMPGERFLWEISIPLLPQMRQTPTGPQPILQMNEWIVLSCPSPILGEGTVLSGMATDLRKIADDERAALDAVRHLIDNLRSEVARKLALESPPRP